MDRVRTVPTSPTAAGYLTRPGTRPNQSVTPGRGWDASSLLEMMLTQAIANAAEARKRAAVLLIGFETDRVCLKGARDWNQTVDALARGIPNRCGDWGALRVGAAEIAVILGEIGDSLDALVRANEILAVLHKTYGFDGCGTGYRVAIGVGLFPEDGADASILLDRASEALADMRMMGLSAAGFSMRRMLRGSPTRTVPRFGAQGATPSSRLRHCSDLG